MPRGGQNRKPVELHKIHGTYNATKHKDVVSVPGMTTIPIPPPDFDKQMVDDWYQIYGAAVSIGVNIETEFDMSNMVQIVRLQAAARKLFLDWQKQPDNPQKLNSFIKVEEALLKFHIQHGMTPLSRQAIRMQPAPKEEKSAFDKLREKMEKLNGE